MCNDQYMSQQRQHILLSYFKTLTTSSTGLFSLALEVGRPTYEAREKRPGDEVENLSVGPAVVKPTTPGGRYSLI